MPVTLLPLDECGAQLNLLFLERAKHNLVIWRENKAVAERQRALIPEGGWPGKNQEARDAARDAAYGADDTLKGHLYNRDDAQGKLIQLEEEIAGVEADRRAGEWRIRERMVEALTQSGVAPQGRGDRMEGALDGDAIQAAADDELTAAFNLATGGETVPAGSDDGADIPF